MQFLAARYKITPYDFHQRKVVMSLSDLTEAQLRQVAEYNED